MAWKTDPEEGQFADKYLVIESPKNKGEVTRVTIRIIDSEPEGTWRHWYNQRPYNCPGKAGNCPVCEVRNLAKDVDPDYRNKYRLEHIHVFNVLHDGKVKVFTFKQAVASKLREFIHEYGDLRNYDVVIKKEKNGPMDLNIVWDVIYKGERPLTDEEKAATEEKFDLVAEVAPAAMDILQKVARNEVVKDVRAEEKLEQEVKELVPAGNVTTVSIGGSDTFIKFAELVRSQGKGLDEYGIDEKNPPSDRIIRAMLKEMDES